MQTRIGTRASPLAVLQAQKVADALKEASHGTLQPEIVKFTTRGDQLSSERLSEAGGKGLFTREIDQAVSDGRVDIGVHSLKDMPGDLPDGQILKPVLVREDARDVFLSERYRHLKDLPNGAVIGTASLRREAQLLSIRPDLKVVTFRGNVQTRLRKLKSGEVDATFLAKAGLNRLNLTEIGTPIPLQEMLPACGQGIIAVTILETALSGVLGEALATIADDETVYAASAERSMLKELDGDCRTPIAGHLFREANSWILRGEVLETDGAKKWVSEERLPLSSDLADFRKLGSNVGLDLKSKAKAVIERVKSS